MTIYEHALMCACFPNGCDTEWVRWTANTSDETPPQPVLRSMVAAGWRKDHGRWVCGEHDSPEESQLPFL